MSKLRQLIQRVGNVNNKINNNAAIHVLMRQTLGSARSAAAYIRKNTNMPVKQLKKSRTMATVSVPLIKKTPKQATAAANMAPVSICFDSWKFVDFILLVDTLRCSVSFNNMPGLRLLQSAMWQIRRWSAQKYVYC
jgi:hypothetical protein